MSDAHEPAETLLSVRSVAKHFPISKGVVVRRHIGAVKAVDGVSFDLHAGETLALVGESGCGKSTIGRLALRLLESTAGQVKYRGQVLDELSKRDLRALRREMQIIFQDPFASLNPRLTVAETLGEPLTVHNLAHGVQKRQRIEQLLETVGLSAWHMQRYPHEFSGGQRQRIGIARALAGEPRLIVCDEPVSALDVSIQAQVINLLMDLQHRYGLAYLFISHDMAVVKHISHRVAVMYLGKLVETASKAALFSHPRHPYTHALLSAVPLPNPTAKRERLLLEGDVPSPLNPPDGCRFHTRCPFATERCGREIPELEPVADDHQVACHHWREITAPMIVGSDSDNRSDSASERPPVHARLALYRRALEDTETAGADRSTSTQAGVT